MKKHTKVTRRQEIRFCINRIRSLRRAYINYTLAGYKEVAAEYWDREIEHQISNLNLHLKLRFRDPDF